MNPVKVVGSNGKPLMPTRCYRARKLLQSGRAKIYGHRPFTIQILDREDTLPENGKEVGVWKEKLA